MKQKISHTIIRIYSMLKGRHSNENHPFALKPVFKLMLEMDGNKQRKLIALSLSS